MLPIVLLLGSVIIGGGLLATFWSDILDFLQESIRKAQRIANDMNAVLEGSKILIRKVREGIEEISRHYFHHRGQWYSREETRRVPADQVPEDIRRKAKYDEEYDITDELEMQLNV